jgi:carbon-monoxide dehydrogenase large subunit
MTSTALLTNKTPSGTYRAPGRYEGSFFCERLIELAARELGIDSAEMRRRNLIGAGEMPYRLPRLEPGGPAVDTECDSGDYRETLEHCLAEFGWAEKRALQGRQIDGRYHGVAVACFIEGGGAGPKETARLDLEADGTVSVYVGSAAVGQGLKTVMAQIAADTLGLPLGQVRVLHGSTPFLDEGYGAFASRSTVLGGSAVLEAANALLAKIRAAAGARLGCAAEQIELADGCVSGELRHPASVRSSSKGSEHALAVSKLPFNRSRHLRIEVHPNDRTSGVAIRDWLVRKGGERGRRLVYSTMT